MIYDAMIICVLPGAKVNLVKLQHGATTSPQRPTASPPKPPVIRDDSWGDDDDSLSFPVAKPNAAPDAANAKVSLIMPITRFTWRDRSALCRIDRNSAHISSCLSYPSSLGAQIKEQWHLKNDILYNYIARFFFKKPISMHIIVTRFITFCKPIRYTSFLTETNTFEAAQTNQFVKW